MTASVGGKNIFFGGSFLDLHTFGIGKQVDHNTSNYNAITAKYLVILQINV